MIKNFYPTWIMSFYVFSCNIIKFTRFCNVLLDCYILIFSFSDTSSLFLPYAYVSIELVDFIILLSLGLNAILLPSSVRRLCFSLLNIFVDFNINLLYIILVCYMHNKNLIRSFEL